MTLEDIEILKEDEVKAIIERNIDRDPARVALDRNIPHSSLVATQVKYLQRARRKLLDYYDARAIIPSLAFEQSSSGDTAALRKYSGEMCIDLTCGLGVDTLHFSRCFRQVVSIERDSVVAAVAAENFSRLRAGNVTVVTGSAEDYLRDALRQGLKADMIFADPDRRSAKGEKLVRLEDCSPDVVTLFPVMKQIAGRIVIKASPMFDIAEAYRLFGDSCIVDVVSVRGECKEVLIEIADDVQNPGIKATAAGIGMYSKPYDESGQRGYGDFSPPYKYMMLPDVSLRKSRLTTSYAADFIPDAYVQDNDSYVFFNAFPGKRLLGRVFEILYMSEYAPKPQRRRLVENGIISADIYRTGFPLSNQAAAKALGIREGGNFKIALTETADRLWYIELKEIPLF